jgi:hypothetical protein
MTNIFEVFSKMVNIVTSTTGHKKGLVTAAGTRDWVLLCFFYMSTVFGAIVLATTMVVQYFLLGILQQILSTILGPLQHHHCPRAPSARDYRRG